MSAKFVRSIGALEAGQKRALAAQLSLDINRMLAAQRQVGGNLSEMEAEMFGKWGAYTDETDVKGLMSLRDTLARG